MAFRRKTIAIVLSIILAVLAVTALLVSILVDPDAYRPQVISFLEARTGKQIEIGHIAVNWLPLSIRLDNFGTRNPKPFPSGYFFKAASIDATLDLWALLHRRVAIKSVVLHDPVINVISDPDGLWNFENPATKAAPNSAPIFSLGTISLVTITGGRLLGSSLIDPSDRPGPVVFEVHNLSATLHDVNFHGFTTGAESLPVAAGNLQADSLRLGSVEVTKVKCNIRLQPKQVFFEALSVDADRGRASGDLSFNLTGRTTHFHTSARLSNLDVAQLLERFPQGRGKMTGTMEGEVTLGGAIEHSLAPLAGIRGSGRLTVRNGELPSLNPNDKLKEMTRFRDAKDAGRPPSSFSAFSGDLDLVNQRIFSREVNVAFYGVDMQCSGDVGFTGGGILNYQGVAKVEKQQGFFTNLFARMLHEAKEENGKLVFPIKITGTMDDPKFSVTE